MQFGNYILLKKLGTGGMAEVFLAKQTGLAGFERLVCVKRILPHLADNTEFITMFQDEARIAANLNHPNIVQIYELGEIEGSYFIAMELIKGEDIRQIYNAEVARGQIIPYVNAAQIIYGACNGLGFAHSSCDAMGKPLGLVHRDISPQNILVTYNGYPKIVDFGVAKARGKMTETRAGVLKGKYSYMSPEQAKGKQIDGRSDIFATGIVLYEITTGQRLFKRENEIETLHAVMNCRITPPSKIIPSYPSELEDIVMHSLAADVNERYATCYDFANDLEKFIIGQGCSTSPQALSGYMHSLFADKLQNDPYSPERLEEMAKQASTISLAGRTPGRPTVGESTVVGKTKRNNRNAMMDDVEGTNIISPRLVWAAAIFMMLVVAIVLFLAFGTYQSNKDKQRLAQELAKIEESNRVPTPGEVEPAVVGNKAEPEKTEPASAKEPEPIATQEVAKKVVPQNGTLVVGGNSGWHILINGKDRGSVSQRTLMLPNGSYRIKFVHPESGATHTIKNKIEIRGGKEVELNPPSGAGNIFINAIPYARVWKGDGKLQEDTPKSYQNVPAGDYVIHGKCENGKQFNEVVSVTKGNTARVVFNCNK